MLEDKTIGELQAELEGTLLGEILGHVIDSHEDYVKAKGGNKKAGTRVRKHAMDVKNKASALRKEMLESRPAKETADA